MKRRSRLPWVVLVAILFASGLTMHRHAIAGDGCEVQCSNYGSDPYLSLSCDRPDPSTSTSCSDCRKRYWNAQSTPPPSGAPTPAPSTAGQRADAEAEEHDAAADEDAEKRDAGEEEDASTD